MSDPVATTTVECECYSLLCRRQITIPVDEFRKIMQAGNFIIAKGCTSPISPYDELIENRGEYKIYHPAVKTLY